MATLDHPRKVRIVAEHGLLELRDETGQTLRSLIYTAASPENEVQARIRLTREAIALGCIVCDQPTGTGPVTPPYWTVISSDTSWRRR